MPFEYGAFAPKKIAVIGAGISGMGAAHMLADVAAPDPADDPHGLRSTA